MAKAQGDLSGAIEWLNKYLEMQERARLKFFTGLKLASCITECLFFSFRFMADHDAWRELGDIYISLQM